MLVGLGSLFNVLQQVAVSYQDLQTVRVLFGDMLAQSGDVTLMVEHVLEGLVQLNNVAQTNLEQLLDFMKVLDSLLV